MKRTTIYLLIILGTAASAPAAVGPSESGARAHHTNETVIEKNQAFPRVGPFVVAECLDTACTLTRPEQAKRLSGHEPR